MYVCILTLYIWRLEWENAHNKIPSRLEYLCTVDAVVAGLQNLYNYLLLVILVS